jgi:hypothetical protein
MFLSSIWRQTQYRPIIAIRQGGKGGVKASRNKYLVSLLNISEHDTSVDSHFELSTHLWSIYPEDIGGSSLAPFITTPHINVCVW